MYVMQIALPCGGDIALLLSILQSAITARKTLGVSNLLAIWDVRMRVKDVSVIVWHHVVMHTNIVTSMLLCRPNKSIQLKL